MRLQSHAKLSRDTAENCQEFNPIPNRLGHVIYNERADSALTW